MSAPLVCFPLRLDWELAAGPAPEKGYPMPELVSQEAGASWDAGAGDVPDWLSGQGPVVKLAEIASALSWRVRVQRSRGSLPHARSGAPGPVKDTFAVRGWKMCGVGAAAVRRNFVAVRRADAWETVWLWGPGIGWFGLAGFRDLEQWLSAPLMPETWYQRIRTRVREQELAARQRAASRPKKAKTMEGL